MMKGGEKKDNSYFYFALSIPIEAFELIEERAASIAIHCRFRVADRHHY